MADFKEAVSYVLKNEGGFVIDNGGATNFGITMPILATFRQRGVTQADIEELTQDEAEKIYKKFFWDFMKLDQIAPQATATALLDAGVNRSCLTAIKLGQQIANTLLNCNLVDGLPGPLTMTAFNSIDQKTFIQLFVNAEHAANLGIVAIHPELEIYLKGWDNRAQRLLTLI